MKLINQVCTLEQAKQLHRLGIAPNSLHHWIRKAYLPKKQEWVISRSDLLGKGGRYAGRSAGGYSAFTVAELGVMLPSGFDSMHSTTEGWRLFDLESHDIPEGVVSETEAQARASALIHLLENGLLTPAEVNARLEKEGKV